MLELFALRLGCFERRLQIADWHSSFVQVRSDSWPISEHLAARACDCSLELECWQTPPIVLLLCRTLNYFARDVVAVTARALVGPARVERFTVFVEQLAGQRTRDPLDVQRSAMRGLLAKSFLHLFPHGFIHDCPLLAGMTGRPN